MSLYSFFQPALMMIEPEKAHRLTLRALKMGLMPQQKVDDPVLKIQLWGRDFANPLGMAAGFDKEAEATAALFNMGFGFVEAGTVTPQPQAGNEKPRVFRDIKAQSIINRMGFPGRGLVAFAENVAAYRKAYPQTGGILGVNIGINKTTQQPLDDYKKGIEKLAPLADYIVLNVSSPNTPGLRDLQGQDELNLLLTGVMAARNGTGQKVPLLVKLAPDLGKAQRESIANLARAHYLDGLIIANTTISRPPALAEKLKQEKGGLSGALLKKLSTEILRDFYRLTQGKTPLIGVGGISTADDAYARIRAGASLLQIYTGLVYKGPQLVTDILHGLAGRLRQDGFASVAQAVGADEALLQAAQTKEAV